MTIIRVRLDDEDRKRYGGETPLPEDLTLDTEALKDLTAGELDQIERKLDMLMAALVPMLEPTLGRQSFVRRAAAYLAVTQAGYDVPWDDFQPRLLRAEFTVQEDDPNPPAGPSEFSSED